MLFEDQFKKWNHLPGVEPHWFWGNRHIFTESFKETFLTHYQALKGHRFGLFWYGTEPAIFLNDIQLIKRVQIIDHDHFTDLGQ